MAATDPARAIGRAPERLTLADRIALEGKYVAFEFYTPETLRFRRIEAIGDSVEECVRTLKARARARPKALRIQPASAAVLSRAPQQVERVHARPGKTYLYAVSGRCRRRGTNRQMGHQMPAHSWGVVPHNRTSRFLAPLPRSGALGRDRVPAPKAQVSTPGSR